MLGLRRVSEKIGGTRLKLLYKIVFMPITLEEFLSNASLPQKEVQMCADPSLLFERQQLLEELESKPSKGRRVDAERGTVSARLQVVEQKIAERTVPFKMRALPAEWVDAHRDLATAATKDEAADIEFQLAMLVESLQDPALADVEEARKLRNAVGIPQWKQLMDAIADLTWNEYPIPFD